LARTSWLKKIWTGRSKGVSTVIGTVFLILIIFMVTTNVLLWTFSKNAQYNRAVMERNEEEAQRSTEKIALSNVSYSVEDGHVHIEVKVTNDGPFPVQITTVWVLDKTIRKYGYNNLLNINLKAGDTLDFTGSNALKVAIEGTSSFNEFTSWFVTARGNLIPLEDTRDITQVTINWQSTYPKIIVGALVLDFDKFEYLTYEFDNQLADYPDGIIGFDIPKQTYVAFRCYLTNIDPENRTMIIDSHSLFWQPGRPGVPEGAWFIVNVNGNGTIKSTYSPITLEYGESKRLIFASANDVGLASFKKLNTPNVVTTVATFLLIHGTLGSNPYAQSIPFVSLFYS